MTGAATGGGATNAGAASGTLTTAGAATGGGATNAGAASGTLTTAGAATGGGATNAGAASETLTMTGATTGGGTTNAGAASGTLTMTGTATGSGGGTGAIDSGFAASAAAICLRRCLGGYLRMGLNKLFSFSNERELARGTSALASFASATMGSGAGGGGSLTTVGATGGGSVNLRSGLANASILGLSVWVEIDERPRTGSASTSTRRSDSASKNPRLPFGCGSAAPLRKWRSPRKHLRVSPSTSGSSTGRPVSGSSETSACPAQIGELVRSDFAGICTRSPQSGHAPVLLASARGTFSSPLQEGHENHS